MQQRNAFLSLLFTAGLFLYSGLVAAQDCTVDADSLKGTYSGDCKKGQASGRGRAVGAHSYDGEFKSGQPNGEGTYTWPNGSSYTGKFVKGLKEGKGVLTYKRPTGSDSIVDGFWKKDKYIGKYESAWRLINRTGSVTTVETVYTEGNSNQVKIIIITTTGGVKRMNGTEIPKQEITNINIIKGGYVDIMKFDAKTKGTQTTLTMVTYPLQLQLAMGREEVNIEFNEPGSYTTTIHINQ